MVFCILQKNFLSAVPEKIPLMRKFICIIFSIILPAGLLFPGELTKSDSVTVRIFIIAGQSNAINIHADAGELNLSLIDTTADFYYHCGMPPLSGYPFFSTSGNKWTELGIQRQIPFLGQHEYFFGPEITLVNGLGSFYENAAVIKCAYGGSNLAVDWDKNSVTGNMLYKLMIEQINQACTLLDSLGKEYSLEGFFWIQGESDASKLSYAQAYYENLGRFINGIRTDLNSTELPFFISRLPSRQPYTYLSIIRAAQERAAREISNTKLIDTDSLLLDSDNIHFTASGIKNLGYLMAEAFISTVSSYEEILDLTPDGITLSQNYPNPFNPSTRINYAIPSPSRVTIKIYDVMGREIETLINEEKPAGVHEVNWNTASAAGGLPSGIYFYQIKAGPFTATRKMLLIK